MPPVATDALVLRTFELGETSKIVLLLTRERGKVRAVAKGARGRRSRYQSALEPLSEVRIGLYGRQGAELFRLGECELIRSAFPARGRALDDALLLGYFAELLECFVQEGEAEDDVYRLARSVLRALREGRRGEVMARYLEAWLLRLHGIYPPLDQCAGCSGTLAAGELAYHAPTHGFVCQNCGPAAGPFLSVAIRAFLQRVFRTAPVEMSDTLPDQHSALEAFHERLVSGHLERELRSWRVLRSVNRQALA
jgi:DNA repair protein RecO (recombination protein O)